MASILKMFGGDGAEDMVDKCCDAAAKAVKEQVKARMGIESDDQRPAGEGEKTEKKSSGDDVQAKKKSSGDDDQGGLSSDMSSAADQLAGLF